MKVSFILNILRNRWLRAESWFDDEDVAKFLHSLERLGYKDEQVIKAARKSKSLTTFKRLLGL